MNKIYAAKDRISFNSKAAASGEGSEIEAAIFIALFIGIFAMLAAPMGLANMLNTMMNTAYRLLMDTCFYLMAITVLMGAFAALLSEFGVVKLLNRILSPLMQPLYGLPGVAALGVVTTYLSDNPAILALAKDNNYKSCYKEYQIPALTNLGTSFGMGLIVTGFMLGLSKFTGSGTGTAVVCGNLGAIAGSILSTRLMLSFTKKKLPLTGTAPTPSGMPEEDEAEGRKNAVVRCFNAISRGGKNGVELGLGIIPGVVVICTLVMMLTNAAPEGGYTGAAFEGIGLLPAIGERLLFILKPLFGFTSAECIAVPITALGSAGASLGMIPVMLRSGAAGTGDLAVFTAMCMCWSGYLSTHVSMMDVLDCGRYSGRAIAYHTLGGLFAGMVAHWLFVLADLLKMVFNTI